MRINSETFHPSHWRVIPLATVLMLVVACQSATTRVELPSRFDNNRIHLVPRLESGREIVFFTDTGGGWNAIKASTAIALGGPNVVNNTTMPFPEFSADATIPSNPIYRDGQLTVTIDSDLTGSGDGVLGGRWFGDRIWELDYLRQKVSMLGHLVDHQKPAEHAVDLGFQLGEQDRRTMHFPRMRIEVDGSTFDVLLDTGASATLTEAGAVALASDPGQSIGTSFIRRGIFNAWKREHPDWTIIADVDTVDGQTFSMIQVPELVVAGYAVGPVWFTVRPDSAFLDFMASMMDAPVHGALGGSALKYFRVIVDYPDSRVYFFVD